MRIYGLAKEESINTISSSLNENGKVIITGCLGRDKTTIKKFEDKVLSISGPSEINKKRTVQKVFQQNQLEFSFTYRDKAYSKHYSYLKFQKDVTIRVNFASFQIER